MLSFFAGHTVQIDWLAQTWTGNAVIWLVGIWKGVGWSFIMFLAALDGVPRELVEASRVDGSSEPRVWRHVVIPSIRPTIVFVLVLLVIGGTQVFTQVFLMTRAGPTARPTCCSPTPTSRHSPTSRSATPPRSPR